MICWVLEQVTTCLCFQIILHTIYLQIVNIFATESVACSSNLQLTMLLQIVRTTESVACASSLQPVCVKLFCIQRICKSISILSEFPWCDRTFVSRILRWLQVATCNLCVCAKLFCMQCICKSWGYLQLHYPNDYFFVLRARATCVCVCQIILHAMYL